VLSTGDTCSASEAVVNGLRGIGVEVVLIGGGTCGKPYGFYPASNCGETYYSIQFKGVNDLGFGDYADGFIPNNSTAPFGIRVPGCAITDDLGHELGDENEAMLAAALQYRNNGTCPVTTTRQSTQRTEPESGAVRTSPYSPAEQFLRSSRDMTMPRR
jgi:hypothetical protein